LFNFLFRYKVMPFWKLTKNLLKIPWKRLVRRIPISPKFTSVVPKAGKFFQTKNIFIELEIDLSIHLKPLFASFRPFYKKLCPLKKSDVFFSITLEFECVEKSTPFLWSVVPTKSQIKYPLWRKKSEWRKGDLLNHQKFTIMK